MVKKYWVGFLLLTIFAGAAAFAYLSSCPLPKDADAITLEIPEGLTTAQVADLLYEKGIIRDRLFFRALTRVLKADGKVQAGLFTFEPGIYAWDTVASLQKGKAIYYTITVREGLRVVDIARLIEERGFGSYDAFLEVASDSSLLPGFVSIERPEEILYPLEGYLFPDTYYVRKGMSEREMAVMMLNRFSQVFNKELIAKAEEAGFSPHEVATLASIVEKEVYAPEERPVVASVFLNRLRISMTLGSCPTVLYAIDKVAGPLLWAETEVDSPFNTYKVGGLPPGPIANFGKASLEAVLYPEKVDYLYFVSKNDGTHAFARTLAEHNRNVSIYQGN